MWKTARARLAPPSRRGLLSAVLLVVLLVALVAGLSRCAGDTGNRASTAPSGTSTGAAPSLRERAAPFDVHYRRVAGDIRKARGRGTLGAVSEPVRAWIDAGFVRGPWPRASFGDAFGPFTRDITAGARRDADLLTLQSEGRSFVEVVPQRREIGVSVTGAHGRVVGATARVHLRVLGVSRGGERTAVSLRGDVFLTNVASHGWRIFGYHLDRWVDHGAMTGSKPKSGHKPGDRSEGTSGGKPGGKPGGSHGGKPGGRHGGKPGGKADTRGGS